jgi:broad specificity phosphatase PhoE
MTRLVLIRHGQTDWNREGRFQGQADPPLNVVGRGQVEALAQRLVGWPFESLISSDLRRAVESAEIIARTLNLAFYVDPRWREVRQGQWEGLLVGEIAARYPDEWTARQLDPVHARTPGGETIAEVAARVWAAADDIARSYPVGPVLVVSHAVALATLLVRTRGLSLDQVFGHIPQNAQIEAVDWPPG